MSDAAARLAACNICPKATPPRDGVMRCRLNGAVVQENAAAGTCPDAPTRFSGAVAVRVSRATMGPACRRCGATWHELADCPIHEGEEPTPQDATAGGCGCDGSQTAPATDRPASE